MTSLKRIFTLCPSLTLIPFDECHSAITRMCIAHVMNGGDYVGFYETAVNYLESLK